jgi:hypothetical protein
MPTPPQSASCSGHQRGHRYVGQYAAVGCDRVLAGGGRGDRDVGFVGGCLRQAADLPARAAAVRRLLCADRASGLRWDGDRRTSRSGGRWRDDSGLRTQLVVGGEHRRRAGAGGVPVGGCCSGGRCCRPLARWRAGGRHQLAGSVLGRRRCGGSVHALDLRGRDRVARRRPGPIHRLRRRRAGRTDPRAVGPGAEQGKRLGMGVGGYSRVACRIRRSGVRFRSGRAQGRSPVCSISRCCATGSWWVPRSRSSSAPAPSTR